MERSFKVVPRWIIACLIAAAALQIFCRTGTPVETPRGSELTAPPSQSALKLAAFGDPVPLAKVLMLYLQAFDFQSGSRTPYQALDYGFLQSWLESILSLEPKGQYPLMAASRLYADVPDLRKKKQMLDFVYAEFFKDPQRRWPWLAHAAMVAKHGLGDLPLARKYASAIQQYSKGDEVPLWARQMEIFILEDMNELDAARIMLGGFIDKGLVKHPGELRFLEQRLKDIEARIRKAPAPKK